jgi:hypothetical protein
MAKQQIDLLALFNQVAKTMDKNRASLNKADTYNHDHGDHMVEIFDVITRAMKEKKNADPADQLEYAASILRRQSKSGSGKLYAQGLRNASKQVAGKDLNANTIMSMMQTIFGGTQPSTRTQTARQPAPSGDMLGSLLGSLVSGGQSSAQQGGGMLGDLLGSMVSADAPSGQDGLDLGDLLGAGMSFLSAKQGGKSNLEALTQAMVSGTQMAQTPHRQQSSQLVTQALLKGLSTMLSQ